MKDETKTQIILNLTEVATLHDLIKEKEKELLERGLTKHEFKRGDTVITEWIKPEK